MNLKEFKNKIKDLDYDTAELLQMVRDNLSKNLVNKYLKGILAQINFYNPKNIISLFDSCYRSFSVAEINLCHKYIEVHWESSETFESSLLFYFQDYTDLVNSLFIAFVLKEILKEKEGKENE